MSPSGVAGVLPERILRKAFHGYRGVTVGRVSERGALRPFFAGSRGHADSRMLWRVHSRHIPYLTRRDGSAFEAALARLVA